MSDPARRSSSISADLSSNRSHNAVAAASVAAGLVTTILCRSSSARPSLVSKDGGQRQRRCARIFQGRRRPVARLGAVAPVDGARCRSHGAIDRADQGQPGTNGPRHCQDFRGQGFRAEPAAQDVSASATADCHPDAKTGADALACRRWPSHRGCLHGRPRSSRTLRFVRAGGSALHDDLRLVTGL